MAHDPDPGSGAGGGLSMVLWLAQGLLAVAFLTGGAMKLLMPMPELVEMLGWPGALPAGLVRFIGGAELLGGAGLILPAATRILPWLTPAAAAGLSVIMALAIVFHAARGEWTVLPINIAFITIALFIAWGRSVKAPIDSRP